MKMKTHRFDLPKGKVTIKYSRNRETVKVSITPRIWNLWSYFRTEERCVLQYHPLYADFIQLFSSKESG